MEGWNLHTFPNLMAGTHLRSWDRRVNVRAGHLQSARWPKVFPCRFCGRSQFASACFQKRRRREKGEPKDLVAWWRPQPNDRDSRMFNDQRGGQRTVKQISHVEVVTASKLLSRPTPLALQLVLLLFTFVLGGSVRHRRCVRPHLAKT
jgi:hypothetical protein